MSDSVQDIFVEAISFESSRLAHYGQGGHVQSFRDAATSIIDNGVINNDLLKEAKTMATDAVRDALDGFVQRVLANTSQPS